MTTPRSRCFTKQTQPIDGLDDPDDNAPVVEPNAADERAIERALVSIRNAKGISLDKFRALLRRL